MRSVQPDSTGYAVRDDVKISYEVFGRQEPAILLLPTWGIIHSRFWKGQVGYLSRHHRVITFDGRGSGQSSAPADPEGYEQRLADAGGIDLFLLASGAGDGHVAFNPPGADRDTFKDTAEATKTGCPVSQALLGNMELDLDARLED